MSAAILKKLEIALPPSAVRLTRCAENGCAAKHGITALLVKGESIQLSSEKAADCVFFLPRNHGVIVVIVELKSGSYKVSDVIEKMIKSEGVAIDIVRRAETKLLGRFRMLFASGAHPRVGSAEYVLLARKGGILTRRCGQSIDDMVDVVN